MYFGYALETESGIGIDISYVDFTYPGDSGLDFQEIGIGLSYGDLGFGYYAGQDGAPDYMDVTYAFGDFTIGYQSSEYDAPTATASDDSTAWGVSYQATDDLAISYNEHTVDVGSSATDQESDGISVSYTMGGITIAGHQNEMSAVNGVSGTDDEGYEINLSFAF